MIRERSSRRRARGEWRARIAGALTLAAGVLASPHASAADPLPRDRLVFVADPKMGVETTVRSVDSLSRVIFRYEDALPSIDVDDRRFFGKVVHFFGRGLRLIFLDEPLAELTTLMVHEVGGHGARARELGLDPTFLFYLPGVYRPIFAPNDTSRARAFTQYLKNGVVEDPRDIAATAGGLEANQVHAWWINARIIASNGWVHATDLLSYGATKLPYYDTFFAASTETRGNEGSNDVEAYVSNLQDLTNGWRARDRRRIARRLAAGYLWNFADPTLLYAAYATVVSTLFQGKRDTQMPLPTIGGMAMLLSPRFGLTPFGAEQTLDVFLAKQRRLLDVYARIGTSGLASYYGAGARVLGVPVGHRVTLGGELDLWRQPDLLLDTRGLFERPSRVGLNAGLYGDVRLTNVIGLTGKLAAKTSGYVVGQPLGAGPHGYVGLSLAF